MTSDLHRLPWQQITNYILESSLTVTRTTSTLKVHYPSSRVFVENRSDYLSSTSTTLAVDYQKGSAPASDYPIGTPAAALRLRAILGGQGGGEEVSRF